VSLQMSGAPVRKQLDQEGRDRGLRRLRRRRRKRGQGHQEKIHLRQLVGADSLFFNSSTGPGINTLIFNIFLPKKFGEKNLCF
jgi:hypothetical protein